MLTATAKPTAAEIFAKLESFTNCTDGTIRYCHWMGGRYSEGVQVMAEICQSYWLIDLVFSHQLKKLRRVPIQEWTLTVDRKPNAKFAAAARCRVPGESKSIRSQRIPHTDFPLDLIKLYLVDGVLMLESEYRPATAAVKGESRRVNPFQLGQILATPGALEAIGNSGQSPGDFINRHAAGDWGDVGEDDGRLNDLALVDGDRLLSVYHTANGERIWVITEADRSVTTLLLPSEY